MHTLEAPESGCGLFARTFRLALGEESRGIARRGAVRKDLAYKGLCALDALIHFYGHEGGDA